MDSSNPFKWRQFQGEIILGCVRWYCKYGISYRELEEMMEERGVDVDHTTIYRWVQIYEHEMERRLSPISKFEANESICIVLLPRGQRQSISSSPTPAIGRQLRPFWPKLCEHSKTMSVR